jgi:hypothetical protein
LHTMKSNGWMIWWCWWVKTHYAIIFISLWFSRTRRWWTAGSIIVCCTIVMYAFFIVVRVIYPFKSIKIKLTFESKMLESDSFIHSIKEWMQQLSWDWQI